MKWLLAFLLLGAPAWADDIYIDDGRVCNNCKVHWLDRAHRQPDYLIDSTGGRWTIDPGQSIQRYNTTADKWAQVFGSAMTATSNIYRANAEAQRQEYAAQQRANIYNSGYNCNTSFMGNYAQTECRPRMLYVQP